MPIELISLALSAVVGFLFKLIAANMENKHQQHTMTLEAFGASQKSIESARDFQEPGSAFVRRFIVVTMLSLFTFIIVAPAVYPDLAVNFITEHTRASFLGLFGGGTEMIVTTVKGLVYDETMRSILSSIVGYYFGSSTVKQG